MAFKNLSEPPEHYKGGQRTWDEPSDDEENFKNYHEKFLKNLMTRLAKGIHQVEQGERRNPDIEAAMADNLESESQASTLTGSNTSPHEPAAIEHNLTVEFQEAIASASVGQPLHSSTPKRSPTPLHGAPFNASEIEGDESLPGLGSPVRHGNLPPDNTSGEGQQSPPALGSPVLHRSLPPANPITSGEGRQSPGPVLPGTAAAGASNARPRSHKRNPEAPRVGEIEDVNGNKLAKLRDPDNRWVATCDHMPLMFREQYERLKAAQEFILHDLLDVHDTQELDLSIAKAFSSKS